MHQQDRFGTLCLRKMSKKLMELLKARLWAVGLPFWELMCRPFAWRDLLVYIHVGRLFDPFLYLPSLLFGNLFVVAGK